MKKNKILGVGLVILLMIIIGTIFYTFASQSDDGLAGYKKVEDFQYAEPGSIVCQSIGPECGVCRGGKIVNKACYVKD